jgi:O-antigen ligase
VNIVVGNSPKSSEVEGDAPKQGRPLRDAPSPDHHTTQYNFLLGLLSIAVVGVPLVWTTTVLQGFTVPKESLFYFVLAASIALWALNQDTAFSLTLPRGSGDRAGLAFLALSALSLMWAYSARLGLLSLFRLLALAAFYALVAVALNTQRRVHVLVGLFMAVACVVAGYGVFQFYDMYNFPGRGRPFLLSTLGHPNYASSLVGVGFPLLVGATLSSRGWKRTSAFAGSCLSFAFLLAAQTRSVWVATAASLAVGGLLLASRYEWRLRIREARTALIALGAALLVILLVFSVENPLNRRITVWSRASGTASPESQEYVTVSSRWLIWKATWMMVRDHPLVGVGIGNFPSHSAEYLARARETSPWLDPRYPTEFFFEAHNDYLHILAELGPAGLATFLWFIGWHLVLAYRRLLRPQSTDRDPLWLIGLISSLLVFLVDALFSKPFFVLSSSLAAGLVLASIRRMATFSAASQVPVWEAPPTPPPALPLSWGIRVGKSVAVTLGLAVSMLVSVWATALYVADSFVLRGNRAMEAGDFPGRVAWYERAVRANPLEWRYRFLRGVSYAEVNRYKDGFESLRQAEEFLTRANLTERIGVAYADLGRADRAEAAYRMALWYEPHNRDAWESLTSLLLNQKRFAEAIKEAREGIRSNPTNGKLHLHLALAQAAMGQEADALGNAEAAAEMLPSDRFTFGLLRDLASRVGKSDRVEAADRRLRAIGQYEAFQQLRLVGRAGPQASAFLLGAVVTDAGYADPHFELGRINREHGMTQDAIANFSTYLQLAPRGERAVQAERFIMTLQHPSWLGRIFGIDFRFQG